jgi:transcriptional regulator with XRE-family HTH domain
MKWYERAKLIMKNKNIKQHQVMEAMGVDTRGAVGHYLNGIREPSPMQLLGLANRLDCSIYEIMGNIDPMHLLVMKALRTSLRAINESGEKFSDDEIRRINSACANYALSGTSNDNDIEAFAQRMTTIH